MSEMTEKNIYLDSAFARKDSEVFLVLNDKYQHIRKNLRSTLFSQRKITESFFTNDSRLYITPRASQLAEKGIPLKENRKMFGIDGISVKVVENYRYFRPEKDDFLYNNLATRYEKIRQSLTDLPQNFISRLSLVKLWNVSIATAIIIGMISMTFIYRYLGAGASAEGPGKVVINAPVEQVLGAENIKNDEETTKYIEEILINIEENRKEEFEQKVKSIVKGYPIEKMLPNILEKDRIVAAFLIGIAKKESSWGVHVPVLDGKDCFNYWGYKGQRKLMGTGGHTCFYSRKDAVDTVAKRLQYLIEEKNLNTPAKMVIWKCGSACSKDDQAAVRKWISDVDLYFGKLK